MKLFCYRIYPAPISEVFVYNALGQMVHHTQIIDSESFELQRVTVVGNVYCESKKLSLAVSIQVG